MAEILDFVPLGAASPSVPVSGVGRWLIATPQSQVLSADQDPLDPASIPSSRPTIVRAVQSTSGDLVLRGTTLRLRLTYPDDILPAPFVVIRVYGSEDYLVNTAGTVLNPGTFGPLRNLDNDLAVAFRADLQTDPRIAAVAYQGARVVAPDNTAHSWDCDGCAAFRIAIEVPGPPLSQSGGVYLEAKIV